MGPYLSQPNKNKSTTSGEGKSIIFAASEMQGWRNTMEDAHIHVCDLQPDLSIFGVFDGHGGKEVAIFVERHFIEELQKNKNFKDQKFEDALRETFLKMDELLLTPEGQKEINSIKGGDDDVSYAGCTANVALFYKNTLYVANAGDSRSVLCRENKNYDMSVDHKPDNYEEKQRIERAGGFVSDGRVNGNLNLSRALGDLEYKRDSKLRSNEQLIIALPDIKKVELIPQDKFLLMGCDGVFETLDHADLLKFINQKLGNQAVTPQLLGRVAEDLLDNLIAPDTSVGTGCDNMTTLIIYLKGK
ncbi:unnamed protein product [Paramecium pentaurelia]|uniref:protein-serine/threonine phosphatase n=1 Tax=Paramecium pentaurelia TaxID=43138 RepID=A0A8S1VHI2_9CILI|nr:unnamed protein product [Paramecium pentaurelia]